MNTEKVFKIILIFILVCALLGCSIKKKENFSNNYDHAVSFKMIPCKSNCVSNDSGDFTCTIDDEGVDKTRVCASNKEIKEICKSGKLKGENKICCPSLGDKFTIDEAWNRILTCNDMDKNTEYIDFNQYSVLNKDGVDEIHKKLFDEYKYTNTSSVYGNFIDKKKFKMIIQSITPER